ncbi:MAG: hypothetical protein DID90_2727554435 [Candidatus Nitrotoga sp. LAW]|nr:MAG: hypothetical protein DID90_2727554435 [Candidatus Nitrotoga sp. LAW]
MPKGNSKRRQNQMPNTAFEPIAASGVGSIER